MKLNPKIFRNQQLIPEIRNHFLKIALEFIKNLDIPVDVRDVTLTGSNAGYNYMPGSDLDIHIVVDDSRFNAAEREVFRSLFDAKKVLWQEQHNICVKQMPVELYVQMLADPHETDAEYSILQNKWIKKPAAKVKYKNNPVILKKLQKFSKKLMKETDPERIHLGLKIIFHLRKLSLAKCGMNNSYNTAFRQIRSQGIFDQLRTRYRQLIDQQLTLESCKKEITNEEAANTSRSSNQRSNMLVIRTERGGSNSKKN
jgi:hypothetical protein